MNIEKLKTICCVDPKELMEALYTKFKYIYGADKVVYVPNQFIMCYGNNPICLIAHCDTVFTRYNKSIYYDNEKKVMWSPDGLGTDDRAGIYAILEILQNCTYLPSVIFTNGEERGGIGASYLVKMFPEAPIELNMLIELDRSGYNDAVYYDCYNEEFEKFITGFGFETDLGSFSDISIIAPAWGVAAVNLSVGYEDEHTYAEHLFVEALDRTIHIVKKILSLKTTKKYEYVHFDQVPIDKSICWYCRKPIGQNFMTFKFTGYSSATDDPKHICRNCYNSSFKGYLKKCIKCDMYYFDNDYHGADTQYECPNCKSAKKTNKSNGGTNEYIAY